MNITDYRKQLEEKVAVARKKITPSFLKQLEYKWALIRKKFMGDDTKRY